MRCNIIQWIVFFSELLGWLGMASKPCGTSVMRARAGVDSGAEGMESGNFSLCWQHDVTPISHAERLSRARRYFRLAPTNCQSVGESSVCDVQKHYTCELIFWYGSAVLQAVYHNFVSTENSKQRFAGFSAELRSVFHFRNNLLIM